MSPSPNIKPKIIRFFSYTLIFVAFVFLVVISPFNSAERVQIEFVNSSLKKPEYREIKSYEEPIVQKLFEEGVLVFKSEFKERASRGLIFFVLIAWLVTWLRKRIEKMMRLKGLGT